jgi:hypothetical protein
MQYKVIQSKILDKDIWKKYSKSDKWFSGRLSKAKPLILEQNIPPFNPIFNLGALAMKHWRSGTYTELSNMKMIRC